MSPSTSVQRVIPAAQKSSQSTLSNLYTSIMSREHLAANNNNKWSKGFDKKATASERFDHIR